MLKEILNDKKIFSLLIISLCILFLMEFLTNMRFFTIRNWNSILSLIPEIGILSLGIMLAMLVGGIDLSIVSIANLSALVGANTMLALDGVPMAFFFGLLVSICIGLFCGLINGCLISYIGIHPIVATLGTYQLFRGFGIAITQGKALVNFSPVLTNFTNGSLWELIPNIFIVFLLILGMVAFVLKHTVFGRNIYFVGENTKAAFYSAINTKKVILKTFILIGFLGAIAGIIMSSKTNSAKADYGTSYTLQAILICLLGGVNWTGGVGRVFGVFVAIFTLQFLSSGFGLLRMSNFFMVFFTGLFLIVIMTYNFSLEKKVFI